MPENIFKQVALDILRLHQQTTYSLLATRFCDECEVHDAAYITLNGRYYVWLPCTPAGENDTGILLIEDERLQARLSWVGQTRPLHQKDSLYRRIMSALQRRMRHTKEMLKAADACLLEVIPQHGRLTTGTKDLSLSPNDLVKALYPAAHQFHSGAYAL
ncbi:pyridoxamine 5'-phosphate oxidase family protein [Neisseria sp. ZJ106]|uniref:Pyridoxamine 5'-phosphate oxidase family protein n=1 Tax=Neisseria lisongii TaxID=2912188 RepID=A0AAW5AKA4_9NEIS|nr:pyridoxamine 5'-phosphate oxidase family protein [Neisseria lisongii]MCF7520785.1 pyridoxamine 5'-phosphate oxidase family protein [Neisseria lisongii]MCF7528890.1 pyridoxamine 5'-phosphate oxidase family protein [Neisseria lisongii]WCL70722.1 pyridoxamine 5'-phosphate oxidase family protein [Neisseria lisongii]